MTRAATWIEAALAIGALALGLSLWQERRAHLDDAQRLAQAQTVRTVLVAAKAETISVASASRATAGRVSVRTFRDTLTITDTVEVKAFVARVDTVLALDSTAIADARASAAAERDVTASVRTELELAQRPQPAPRLQTTLALLYDPVTATPAGSAQLSFRIIGTAGAIVRADQRLGEHPRFYVGAQVVF